MNSSSRSPVGCQADLPFGKRLQQPSSLALTFLILLIIINILTFPFTTVLNALVMISVKVKSRLRAHKSNILLGFLAFTDFSVGILVQPAFTVALIMLLHDDPRGYCVLRYFRPVMNVLVVASLFHLVLISGERYLAMKHSFAYSTLLTEARLLLASTFIWFLCILQQVLSLLDNAAIVRINFISIILSIGLTVFCHVTVYSETRRHELQLATQQVPQEARQRFERDRKALKLTSIIVAGLLLCFIPGIILTVVLTRYRNEVTAETLYVLFSFSVSVAFLNSLLNPIIYSVKMRQFRVAFIELLFRNVHFAEAEQIEMRYFGASNAKTSIRAEQDQKGQDEQNAEQGNVNNSDNPNSNELPR